MPKEDTPRPVKGASASLKDGAIQLTYLDGMTSALLTVRGKDHDMGPAEMRELAQALNTAAYHSVVSAHSAAKGSP